MINTTLIAKRLASTTAQADIKHEPLLSSQGQQPVEPQSSTTANTSPFPPISKSASEASSLASSAALGSSQSTAKHVCGLCGTFFSKPSKLKSHIQAVHEGARPYQCNMCDYSFKRKDHLTRHIASKHAEDRNVYKCPNLVTDGCLMSFPNRDQLKKHISRTHNRRSMTCTVCIPPAIAPEQEVTLVPQQPLVESQIFQKKSQLRKHMLEVHGEGYTCKNHCGKKFDKKKYLNSHLARVKLSTDLKQRKMYIFDQSSCDLDQDGQSPPSREDGSPSAYDSYPHEGVSHSQPSRPPPFSNALAANDVDKITIGYKRLHHQTLQSPLLRESGASQDLNLITQGNHGAGHTNELIFASQPPVFTPIQPTQEHHDHNTITLSAPDPFRPVVSLPVGTIATSPVAADGLRRQSDDHCQEAQPHQITRQHQSNVVEKSDNDFQFVFCVKCGQYMRSINCLREHLKTCN